VGQATNTLVVNTISFITAATTTSAAAIVTAILVQTTRFTTLADIPDEEALPVQRGLEAIVRGITGTLFHDTFEEFRPLDLSVGSALRGAICVAGYVPDSTSLHTSQDFATGRLPVETLHLQLEAGATLGVWRPILETTFRIAVRQVHVILPGLLIGCGLAWLCTNLDGI